MCFNIHSRHNKKKRATKDIVVFKIFKKPGRNYTSPFREGCDWKINEVKRAKFDVHLLSVYDGLHSFSSLTAAKKFAEFHGNFFYKYLPHYKKCIIPKGATYFVNPSDEQYVSTQLKLTKLKV